MPVVILVLLIALPALTVSAQKDLPLARLASDTPVRFNHQDLEWLEYGGTITVSIRVDKEGKPTVLDVFGPAAPCSALTHERIGSLRKAVSDAMAKATYEPATDKKGNPVDGGLTMRIKVPSRRPSSSAPVGNSGPPPPAADRQLTGGIITGTAIDLKQPSKPIQARAMRVTELVVVEVLIDESGKVIRAGVVSGGPLFHADSLAAACGSTFKPVKLGGEPVRVSGMITYTFKP